MPKRGRNRKKSRTHVPENENGGLQSALSGGKNGSRMSDSIVKVPKSLVIRRGKKTTTNEINELVSDLRHLMMPYTALNYIDHPSNRKLTLQQYTSNLALPMGITHILSINHNTNKKKKKTIMESKPDSGKVFLNSKTNSNTLNLQLVRTPDGPTLSFRIHQFSLNKHLRQLQNRPVNINAPSLLMCPPIVVTNNFGDYTNAPPHIKLMRITFQNLFPQINVSTIKLNDCRRVVLFNLLTSEMEVEDKQTTTTTNDDEEKTDDDDGNKKTTTTKMVTKQIVHVRHYAIKATPVGVNRRVRKLVVHAKVPNLSKCQDIADYIQENALGGGYTSDGTAGGGMSDSEGEEGDVVQLPDTYKSGGKGNMKNSTSALKLIEIGPRMDIELYKVEKGLNGGDVLYHSYIRKSIQEATYLKQQAERKKQLKQQRQQIQQQNVDKKKQLVMEKKEKKRLKYEISSSSAIQQQQQQSGSNNDSDNDDDDDNDENRMSSNTTELDSLRQRQRIIMDDDDDDEEEEDDEEEVDDDDDEETSGSQNGDDDEDDDDDEEE